VESKKGPRNNQRGEYSFVGYAGGRAEVGGKTKQLR